MARGTWIQWASVPGLAVEVLLAEGSKVMVRRILSENAVLVTVVGVLLIEAEAVFVCAGKGEG